jgi:sulfate adenylyltransferase subunit 2
MHVDTGHNFPEVIAFRDRRAAELGERLLVRSVEDSIRRGSVRLRAEGESRNAAQSVTLLEAIAEFGFDAAIGGARRDEEKARAKERVFFRDERQWDPRNQRPELWNSYNARCTRGARGRSRSATGRSSTSGNTSGAKRRSRRTISRTAVVGGWHCSRR